MGRLLDRLAGGLSRTVEALGPFDARGRFRAEEHGGEWSTSDDIPAWVADALGIPFSALSTQMNEREAVGLPAVFSCIQVIAGTVSSLPLKGFTRGKGGERVPLEGHPVSELLSWEPNEESFAFQLRETLLASVLLRGNGYARVVRDGGGDVRELWHLKTAYMRPYRKTPGGPLLHEYSEPGVPPERELRLDQLWRIPGLSLNGITGLSPVGYFRQTLGIARDLQETGASSLKNETRVPGILYPPEGQADTEDTELEALGEGLDIKQKKGPKFAGTIPVLEDGWRYEKTGMTFLEADYINQCRFSLAETARIYRVPLHMLYDDKAQPRANMEQASLEFVVYTLRPWLVRLEQTMRRDLLTPQEKRAGVSYEHNVAGLLRGDVTARTAYYAAGRQWGWLSVNKILQLENMESIGPEGDNHLQPSNMIPMGSATDPWVPKESKSKEAA